MTTVAFYIVFFGFCAAAVILKSHRENRYGKREASNPWEPVPEFQDDRLGRLYFAFNCLSFVAIGVLISGFTSMFVNLELANYYLIYSGAAVMLTRMVFIEYAMLRDQRDVIDDPSQTRP